MLREKLQVIVTVIGAIAVASLLSVAVTSFVLNDKPTPQATPAAATNDGQYLDTLVRMLHPTEQLKQLYFLAGQQVAQRNREIPAEVWEKVDLQLDGNAVYASLSKIYGTVLAEEHARDILEFYETPTGARVLDKQPDISAATAALFQQVTVQVAEKLDEQIKAAMTAEDNVEAPGEEPEEAE